MGWEWVRVDAWMRNIRHVQWRAYTRFDCNVLPPHWFNEVLLPFALSQLNISKYNVQIGWHLSVHPFVLMMLHYGLYGVSTSVISSLLDFRAHRFHWFGSFHELRTKGLFFPSPAPKAHDAFINIRTKWFFGERELHSFQLILSDVCVFDQHRIISHYYASCVRSFVVSAWA